jgi:hypothetical protein
MIIGAFLRVLTAILTPTSDADAEALHRFSPNEVTVARAYDHVWSARVAAAIYHVDADMVLAISWHESRFTDSVVATESGGRVSCGTMTPYPTRRCVHKSLLEQYLDGTRHWVIDWGHARDVRDAREVLLGYAGGYYLIHACREGPVLRYETHGDDLCKTPEVFWWIRDRIYAARQVKVAS